MLYSGNQSVYLRIGADQASLQSESTRTMCHIVQCFRLSSLMVNPGRGILDGVEGQKEAMSDSAELVVVYDALSLNL